MKYMLLLLAAFTLSGCFGPVKEEPEYVKETKYVLIPIPEAYLEHCAISQPPNKETYPRLTYREKETALVNYITLLHADIGSCNTKFDEIKAYMKKYKDKAESLGGK